MRAVRVTALQRGDVIRLPHVNVVRTVDRVIDLGYRGIVGNRPIYAVWYDVHDDDHGAYTGNSFCDTDTVEVLDVAERVAETERRMLAHAIANGEVAP